MRVAQREPCPVTHVCSFVVQAELDLRVSQDQVSALKKHNAQLACRCREEAKAKLKEHDERVETQDKVTKIKKDKDISAALFYQECFGGGPLSSGTFRRDVSVRSETVRELSMILPTSFVAVRFHETQRFVLWVSAT